MEDGTSGALIPLHGDMNAEGAAADNNVPLELRAPHEFIGCHIRQHFEGEGDAFGKICDWHVESGSGLFRIEYPDDAEVPQPHARRARLGPPPAD